MIGQLRAINCDPNNSRYTINKQTNKQTNNIYTSQTRASILSNFGLDNDQWSLCHQLPIIPLLYSCLDQFQPYSHDLDLLKIT